MHRRLFARPSRPLRSVTEHRLRGEMPPRSRALHLLSAAAVVALWLMAVPTTAGAQGDVLTVDFDDVVFASAGAIVPVGSVAVGADLQGRTCLTSVVTANQSSIHPENDLLIATGGSKARIEDVEDFTNGTNSWLVDITLGSSIDMSVEMGPDGISSLGFTVEIDCSKPLAGSTVPVLASSVTTTTTTTSTTLTPEATGSTTVTTTAPETTITSETTTSETTALETTTSETTSEVTGATTTTSPASSSTQLQVQETTTTAATTVSSTTAPTVTIPTTTTTQSAEATTTTASQGQLEQSPPASAVPAQPSYTG